MRWVALALLLVNAGLFGFFKLSMARLPGNEPVTGHEPISPEKIKILTQEQLTALPKRPPTPANPPSQLPQPQFSPVAASASTGTATAACYEWGSFPTIEAVRAKAALDKLGVQSEPRQLVANDSVRYWVYIPPRRSQEDAQAKVDELKALGVEESYIVQEPVWRYAISLGVFKDEALANKFLDGLRSRGVRSAVKGRHSHEGGLTSYIVKNVSQLQASEFGKVQPEFPGSEFKQISCQ